MKGGRNLVRTVVPHRLRHYVRSRQAAVRAVLDAPKRIERLETMMLESHDRTRERSQERWRAAPPSVGLTFGRQLRGDAFIEIAERYGAFGEDAAVVEVGPGYGRLIDAALRRGVPFSSWTGVDLSARNVAHLRERFAGDQRFEFVAEDAERVSLPGEPNALLSSLTLKHVYPSFEGVLKNLAGELAEGATIVIDLIEGDRRYFQDDAQTYIRWYGREEVTELFDRAGCEVTAFDEVAHDPDHVRLVVVGRRR